MRCIVTGLLPHSNRRAVERWTMRGFCGLGAPPLPYNRSNDEGIDGKGRRMESKVVNEARIKNPLIKAIRELL